MQQTNIFVTNDKGDREVDYEELNQLKKDILWVFDENGAEMHNSYIPVNTFTLPYWDYLTIYGDKFFYPEDRKFYVEGAGIIILCMIAEYIDLIAGDQSVFGNTPIQYIITQAERFIPQSKEQQTLQRLLLNGLGVSSEITQEQILNKEDLDNPELHKFRADLSWVAPTFILPYYRNCIDKMRLT